jgi:hypothetical protein
VLPRREIDFERPSSRNILRHRSRIRWRMNQELQNQRAWVRSDNMKKIVGRRRKWRRKSAPISKIDQMTAKPEQSQGIQRWKIRNSSWNPRERIVEALIDRIFVTCFIMPPTLPETRCFSNVIRFSFRGSLQKSGSQFGEKRGLCSQSVASRSAIFAYRSDNRASKPTSNSNFDEDFFQRRSLRPMITGLAVAGD